MRRFAPFLLAALAAFFVAMASFSPAHAAWIKDGVLLSALPQAQNVNGAAPDGAGGMVIVWQDQSLGGGDYNIAAQRVDANGNALWAQNGVIVCNAANGQWWPRIVSDGAGGVVITWEDERNGGTANADIYAQRLSADGGAMWTANGVPVCTAIGRQTRPEINAEGAVAVITWLDGRTGADDVYVQRVSATGTSLWTANGVAVCTATGDQAGAVIIADGQGGAIAAWQDPRSGNLDVYAQVVNFLGTPAWAPNGVVVVGVAGTQQDPKIISDGQNGAILTWEDLRTPDFNVYAQRLSPAGTRLWSVATSGVALGATIDESDNDPTLVSDGAGGAIVAWAQSANNHIYAQRVTGLGVPLWQSNGVPLGSLLGTQERPQIVQDGLGGAIVVWRDANLYDAGAQRIDANGIVYWASGGVEVAGSNAVVFAPLMVVGDGAGGTLVGWSDNRSLDMNVYAQRVEPLHGYWGHPEPSITSASDQPGDQGGLVALNWTRSDRDVVPLNGIGYYSIWRAVDAVAFSSHEAEPGRLTELSAVGPDFAGPAYRVEHAPAGDYYWEFVANQNAVHTPGYSYLVPTRDDSTAAGPAVHYFQVVAHTSNPTVFFPSNVDSGYSVDNLAPSAPINLIGQSIGDDAQLYWQPGQVNSGDISHYIVYRSQLVGVTPTPANYLVSVPDLSYLDSTTGGLLHFYVVTAVDFSENESSPSNEVAVPVVTGIDDSPPFPQALTLLPSTPNPFAERTVVRYGTPSAGFVAIELYDVAGRRVHAERLAHVPAGWHEYAFSATDATSPYLAAGVYFLRLGTAGAVRMQKLVIVR